MKTTLALALVFPFWFSNAATEFKSTEVTRCNFKVHNNSAYFFEKWLKIIDGMFAHLEIQFLNNKTSNATEEVLFPNRWIWTFVPPGGGRFYISWPVDYNVYSFGLLDTQTLKYPVKLYLNATPEDCIITFGENRTTQAIGDALYDMSKTFYKINGLYDYSYWCYMSTNSGFKNPTWRNLNRYLGVPLQLFGYKCCYNNIESKRAECDEQESNIWNTYQSLPFYIGFIFFAYFPIALIKCSQRAIEAGNPSHPCLQQYTKWQNENEKYIFMQRRGPITVSTMFLGIFGVANKYPVMASRIRRAVFVCFSPFVVYIFIIIYYIRDQDLMMEIVRHGIPSGFVSVLGGLKKSMYLYLPMFGGPAISLILYIIIGLFVMLLPRDTGEIFELGLPSDDSNYSTLLQMNLKTIEAFSKKKCYTVRGYKKVYSVLRGNVHMMINPYFWYFVVSFHLIRWKSFIQTICPCCMGKLFRIICCLPLVIPYIFFCLAEIAIFVIYYGLPIVFFVVCAIRGFVKYFRQRRRELSFLPYMILSSIVPVCILFHFFMMIMITLESFTIIGYFIFFVYLSLIIFPSRSFGFVYYFIMFIFYVSTVLQHFEQEYKDLLNCAIKASVKIERAEEYLAKNKSISNERSVKNIDAMTHQIPTEMLPISLTIQDQNGHRYIRYMKQIPGIRRELFQYVIQRYQPVHIACFHMIVQIVLVQILVLASIVFISKYIANVTPKDASEVLNVMSVIIVTMIPNILRLFFSHAHDKNVRKRKVRQTVIEFWEKKQSCEEREND